MDEAREQLQLSRKHLAKVQRAVAADPVDWADLTIFGLYAVETAVVAAGAHVGISDEETHPGHVRLARKLHHGYDLPNIEEMLKDLQRNRLYEAYGKIQPSGRFDAEDIATAVEAYVDAVGALING